MKPFIRSRLLSFNHAFRGLFFSIRTQKNTWLHLLATCMVIILALWLELPPMEWALLFLVIGSVWMAELLNTSIETLVDLVSPQQHNLAKRSKDVAAAAVLISSITAVIIGILILGLPLWQKIRYINSIR